MLLQWRDELDARFGLRFEILDKDYVQSVRRERGFGVNPWTAHSWFLISQRLLIDESYAGPLRDWLGTFRAGSLLVLDEAHHAAPSSGQRTPSTPTSRGQSATSHRALSIACSFPRRRTTATPIVFRRSWKSSIPSASAVV
jgi:hypothetical protein